MLQDFCFEKPRLVQGIKYFPAITNPEVHYHVHKSSLLHLFLNQFKKMTYQQPISRRPISILSSHLLLGLPSGLSSWDINPFKPSGNYISHLLQQSVTLHFLFTCFVWFSVSTAIISLNSVNKLIFVMEVTMIFVMVKCSVFFAVRTEFLNII
jgi:hypothetical protein